MTSSQDGPTLVVSSAAAPAQSAVPSLELGASIVEAMKGPLLSIVSSAVQAASVSSSSPEGLPVSSGPSIGIDRGPTDLHCRTQHLVQAGASSPWSQTNCLTAQVAQSGASIALPLNQGVFLL